MKYASDFKAEEKHLEATIDNINKSAKRYEEKKKEADEQLRQVYEIYQASDDNEGYDQIPILENMKAMYQRDVDKYKKLAPKPYFGKIVYQDKQYNQEYSVYIGKKGITDYNDSTNLLAVDWRAPIATVYYSDNLGLCNYTTLEGDNEVDLKQKTTFDINNSKLIDLYDTEFIANDDLLVKYLSKNKDVVLNEIIATIQEDQNKIIRMSPYKSLIVQGVAGSGKTTVALHRIAHMLYNYFKYMTAEDVYIIASNKLFLNYITSMLPDLDVVNINEGTIYDVLISAIRRYVPKFKCEYTPVISNGLKYDKAFSNVFDSYFKNLEKELFYEPLKIFHFDILTKSDMESIVNDEKYNTLKTKAELLDARILFVLENLKDKIQSYAMKNRNDDQVVAEAKEAFKLKLNGIYEEEFYPSYKNMVNKFRGYFKKKYNKLNYKKLFSELCFAYGQGQNGLKITKSNVTLDINDLSLIILILNKLERNTFLESIKHIVIDEAQDLNVLTYYCLKTIFNNARFTIVGDVMQNIESNGLHDWNAIVDKVFNADIEYLTLLKSYRNTIEISNFAKKIVEYHTKEEFKTEPVVRHGDEVQLYAYEDEQDKLHKLKAVLSELEAKNSKLNAIICKDPKTIQALYEKAKDIAGVEILLPDMEQLNFKNYIVSLKDSKGLEFDGVVIWDFDDYDLRQESYDYKLLYVAATRALHQLHVFTNNREFN